MTYHIQNKTTISRSSSIHFTPRPSTSQQRNSQATAMARRSYSLRLKVLTRKSRKTRAASTTSSTTITTMATTSKPFPYFKLPRELRDLVYEQLVTDAPTLSHPTPDGGYNFSVKHLINSPILRLNKQFSTEVQATIFGPTSPPPRMIVRDHGIKLIDDIPPFVLFFSEKIQELECLFYCTAGSKTSELRDHVCMVEDLVESCGRVASANVKIYMQRRVEQVTQDFPTLCRSSQTGPKFWQLRGMLCVKISASIAASMLLRVALGLRRLWGRRVRT